MSEVLLWLHPLMQVCAAVLGVWAMWQGLKRVAMLLGKKTLFPWKQHVRLGTVALVLWILGALGFFVTLDLFGSTHITGLLAELAWPIIGLAVLGLITGYIMNRYKKKRKILPLIHGAINVLLIILVAVPVNSVVQLWIDFSLVGNGGQAKAARPPHLLCPDGRGAPVKTGYTSGPEIFGFQGRPFV